MTSYQKLKWQNQHLLEVIRVLVTDKDPISQAMQKTIWKNRFELEDIIWSTPAPAPEK